MHSQVFKAGPSDIPEIYAIAEKIWHIHYPSIISLEQIDYMLGNFYSPEALHRQMMNGQQFYLIKSNGQLIGYLSESEITTNNYFLHKFYILNEAAGKGLGSDVFRAVFNKKENIKSVRLNVNRMNFKSINFYFKLGFKIVETVDIDIGNGFFMNDFVMELKY